MGFLLWVAAAFVIAWLILAVFVKVAGFAVHLLLFAAAVALIAWAVRRFAAGTTHRPI